MDYTQTPEQAWKALGEGKMPLLEFEQYIFHREHNQYQDGYDTGYRDGYRDGLMNEAD